MISETLVRFVTAAIYLGIPEIEKKLSQLCCLPVVQGVTRWPQGFSFDDISQLLSLALQNGASQKQSTDKAEPLRRAVPNDQDISLNR